MYHLRSECVGTLTVLSLKQNSAANWYRGAYCNEVFHTRSSKYVTVVLLSLRVTVAW